MRLKDDCHVKSCHQGVPRLEILETDRAQDLEVEQQNAE
jgi:hypothetical protein